MAAKSDWIDQLLSNLDRSGPQGRAACKYLTEHRIHLDLHDQPTGARWTLARRLQLHPRYAEDVPNAAYPLSLVVHEVRHLQQGVLTALSVRGELEAWQDQFSYLRSLTGHYHEVPYNNETIAELMSISLNWDRHSLNRARNLMQAYAGKTYRVDLLPLYPFHKELMFLIAGYQPPAV